MKEIAVGTHPDCHATSPDNRYLYIACFEGLYCIDQETLEVVKVLDTGRVYATNVLPDRETLLVHDLCGGVIIYLGYHGHEPDSRGKACSGDSQRCFPL